MSKTKAIAVDEEAFSQAFESVASLPIYSAADLLEHMNKVKESLTVNSEDWDRRVLALKNLRGVVFSGGHLFEEFMTLLRALEQPVNGCLRDLRSQVVRESCVTVSYLSEKLACRFDHFAETIIQTLINLIPNSAKIMSSSGLIAINFIIKNTHAPRLLPILCSGLNSKSNVVRRYTCEFMEAIFSFWPENIVEKNLRLLQETLKKGLSDADQDARAASRRSFSAFALKFPDKLEPVLQCMDPTQRKLIGKVATFDSSAEASAASSRAASQANLTALTKSTTNAKPLTLKQSEKAPSRRSTLFGTGDVNKAINSNPKYGVMSESRRKLSSKTVSQSQPASRDHSPSDVSPVGAIGQIDPLSADFLQKRVPTNGFPRSMTSSGFTYSPLVDPSGEPNLSPTPSDILQTHESAGNAHHTANIEASNNFGRKHRDAENDEISETSSVVSDRHAASVFDQDTSRISVEDVTSRLKSLQLSGQKDGLLRLQSLLRSGEHTSAEDVIGLANILTSSYKDVSNKILVLFTETLQLLVKTNHSLLHDWLSTALLLMFNRLSREILQKNQKEIRETLVVFRSHFPLDLQFAVCCQFINDDKLLHISKVKHCILEYLAELLVLMPMDAFKNPSPEVVNTVTRIVSLSMDPKSADIRRLSSRAITKMSSLSHELFSTLLLQTSKSTQQQAAKLLKSREKPEISRKSSAEYDKFSQENRRWSTFQNRTFSLRRQSTPTDANLPRNTSKNPLSPAVPKSRLSAPEKSSHDLDGSSSHIQKPSPLVLKDVQNETAVYNARDDHNRFSVVSSPLLQHSPPCLKSPTFRYHEEEEPSYFHPDSPPLSPSGNRHTSLLSGFDLDNDRLLFEDVIEGILRELCNYNERYEWRNEYLVKLSRLLRTGSAASWSAYSKQTLLVLLESLSDNSELIRSSSLQVLKELLRTQGEFLQDYACLTIMKILEACTDRDKGVVRSAEECANVVATTFSHALCLPLLTAVINDTKNRLNLPAVKMQTAVVKASSPPLLRETLPELVPGLINGCKNEDCSMRKESIECLVHIVLVLGDEVWPYLEDLDAGKKRLLRLYIGRELQGAISNGH